ncbi:MAG: alpha-L-fucosidase [Mycobacteriales bacterium]
MQDDATRGPLGRRRFLGLMGAAAGTAAVAGPLAGPLVGTAAADGGGRQHARSLGNRYRLQRSFVDRRFGMFLHFNMGTYHDMEWTDPGQDPLSFNPVNFNPAQWADAAASAGMTFAVLTAKHHDGFCLWPTKYSSYGVMASSYRRDVVRQYMDAFRARGITPALYFSIWDRTVPGVAPGEVTPAGLQFVKNQLTELLTHYGRIPVLITDGWSWSMGHQEVPYGEIRQHIHSLQPDCLFLDLNGVPVAWDADLTFWEEPKPGQFVLPGNNVAAIQGQTITPFQWFWHPNTPTAGSNLLTTPDIVDGHLRQLEQRNATFLLNCPPNPQGLLDANIVARLADVGRVWRPDRTRAPLPPQPDVLLHPITPVGASATSGDAAMAVEGHNDWGWNGNADQRLWQTTAPLPQSITLDLGARSVVDTLTYLPRQDNDAAGQVVTDGNITAYRVSVSTTGRTFTSVARGHWAADRTVKRARFGPTRARFVRIDALAGVGGSAAANEFGIGRSGGR